MLWVLEECQPLWGPRKMTQAVECWQPDMTWIGIPSHHVKIAELGFGDRRIIGGC